MLCIVSTSVRPYQIDAMFLRFGRSNIKKKVTTCFTDPKACVKVIVMHGQHEAGRCVWEFPLFTF